jgi:hypothetical protein
VTRGVLLRASVAFAAAGALAAILSPASPGLAARAAEPPKCLRCHAGIEDMHPAAPVGCTECHGGDPTRETKEEAHVTTRFPLPNDERVVAAVYDPAVLRFKNPMDLRVAQESCGPCHPSQVERVPLSLHGTTSGHLADGLYENGVVKERHPRVSIFPAADPRFDAGPVPAGAVRNLQRIGGFRSASDPRLLSTHFSDLPRKACMVCHAWSRGRAVRGRLGMDGDYRSEGCASCHVRFEDDGISRSADPTVSRVEAGHPAKHAMQRVPDTATCTRCHYGDASIGLSFRGLAQPVPGMPQSPDAPGFSRKRMNGVFYLEDPAVDPPDVHHARGMQCADCHTGNDTMGDGRIYVRMEDAVEIRCSSCHGTPGAATKGLTARGRRIRGLEVRKDGAWLKRPFDGRTVRLKQARDVVDPRSPDFNPRAALAMTSDHDRLECYACHAGWAPNFFGFHFDRNEGFTQLDVLEGGRTPGRVSTQEKVFATFKHFTLGWNSHGSVAPYMVGFSTMATVHAADGTLLLDQEMPVTAAGLSGMTMIHHQPHTTTPRARTCVECHRAPAAWGYGTVNHRLAREILFAAGERGVQTVGFDRKAPANSKEIGQVPIAAVRAFAVRCDDLQGRASYGFAATADGTLWTLDLRSPLGPKVVGRMEKALEDPRSLLVADDLLFAADGKRGVLVFDASAPARPKVRASVPLEAPAEARGLFLDGPWLYVAAGPAGLIVVDVFDTASPAILSRAPLGDREVPDDARSVSVLFQFSRPNPVEAHAPRLPPRGLAVVANGADGLALVDVTRPEAPVFMGAVRIPGGCVDVALGTLFELGSEGGGIPSREVDYAFAISPGAIHLVDVSTTLGMPADRAPRPVPLAAGGARAVRVVRAYNPPFLQSYALVATAAGIEIVEVTRPSEPASRGTVAIPGSSALAAEEFPLDRMIDSRARPLKDVSHEGARYLDAAELRRVLTAPVR